MPTRLRQLYERTPSSSSSIGKFSIPCASAVSASRAALDRSRLAEALDAVEVGEDRELADEDLGRLAERVLRIDRAVGRDVERELVVVGALTDAGSLDLVRDAAHRREDRVHRDDADRVLRAAVQVSAGA